MNKEDEVQRQWEEWMKQMQDEPLRILSQPQYPDGYIEFLRYQIKQYETGIAHSKNICKAFVIGIAVSALITGMAVVAAILLLI